MLKQRDVDLLVKNLRDFISLPLGDTRAELIKRDITPLIKKMTEEVALGQVEPGVTYRDITPLMGVAMVAEIVGKKLRRAIGRR